VCTQLFACLHSRFHVSLHHKDSVKSHYSNIVITDIIIIINIVVVRFEVLTAVIIKNSVLWDVMAYNPLKVNRRSATPCRLHLQDRRIKSHKNQAQLATCFMLVSGLAYSLTVKMEVRHFTEVSVDFERTMRRYIPDDANLHYHCCYSLGT
jgi:hypothetical protein